MAANSAWFDTWYSADYFSPEWFDLAAVAQPEEERKIYPGAFAAIGSADGLLRIRRKKKKRELDLLFLLS